MKFHKKLIGDKDERAVSPVIGVVLMVAVTVILAATIAAFVMGMGDDLGSNAAPTLASDSGVNNQWSLSEDSAAQDLAYVSHTSGDSIEGENLRIVIRDAETSQALATLDTGSLTDTQDFGTSDDTLKFSYLLNGEDTQSGIEGEEFGGGATITIMSEDTENTDGTGAANTAFDNNVNQVKIQIIHLPTDSTVSEHTEDVPA